MRNINIIIPEGWRIVKFGDVVKDVKESEKSPLVAGLDRYIGLEHIEPENLHIKQWGDLNEDEVSFTKRFRKGQVLFGKRRAYQRKVAVAEFDGICSSDILTFEPKSDDLIPELLPFIVQSDAFFEHALDTSSGSLSPRTRWSQLKDYEFPLPPKDEQRQIAELLEAAEQSIRHQEAAYSEAKILYQRLVDRFYSKPDQPQDSMITILKEVTTKIVDGVHKRPDYVDKGIPFIVVENLNRTNSIDFSDTRFITPTDHLEFIKRTKPERGDVLVSKDGTLGIARIIDTDREFSIFVSVALLKPNRELIRGEYLRYYIESSLFNSHVRKRASGSALKHIHLVDFRTAPIITPSLTVQDEIVSRIRECESACASIESHLHDTRELKRFLLEKLFVRLEQKYVQ